MSAISGCLYRNVDAVHFFWNKQGCFDVGTSACEYSRSISTVKQSRRRFCYVGFWKRMKTLDTCKGLRVTHLPGRLLLPGGPPPASAPPTSTSTPISTSTPLSTPTPTPTSTRRTICVSSTRGSTPITLTTVRIVSLGLVVI